MTILNVSELEYIGESLPKINGNFTELNSRTVSVENITSDYLDIVNFLSTHANGNNVSLKLKNGALPDSYGVKTYQKNDIIGTIDKSKIIYPIPVYLELTNTNSNVDVSFTIKTKELQSSVFVNLINNFKTTRPINNDLVSNSRQFMNFIDLGYYDWQIIISGTSAKSKISYSIKYIE